MADATSSDRSAGASRFAASMSAGLARAESNRRLVVVLEANSAGTVPRRSRRRSVTRRRYGGGYVGFPDGQPLRQTFEERRFRATIKHRRQPAKRRLFFQEPRCAGHPTQPARQQVRSNPAPARFAKVGRGRGVQARKQGVGETVGQNAAKSSPAPDPQREASEFRQCRLRS